VAITSSTIEASSEWEYEDEAKIPAITTAAEAWRMNKQYENTSKRSRGSGVIRRNLRQSTETNEDHNESSHEKDSKIKEEISSRHLGRRKKRSSSTRHPRSNME